MAYLAISEWFMSPWWNSIAPYDSEVSGYATTRSAPQPSTINIYRQIYTMCTYSTCSTTLWVAGGVPHRNTWSRHGIQIDPSMEWRMAWPIVPRRYGVEHPILRTSTIDKPFRHSSKVKPWNKKRARRGLRKTQNGDGQSFNLPIMT